MLTLDYSFVQVFQIGTICLEAMWTIVTSLALFCLAAEKPGPGQEDSKSMLHVAYKK